jgi:hypothetical protein
VVSAEWLSNTICVDTGCVFRGKLTALLWLEKELVEVPAGRVYAEPVRPLGSGAGSLGGEFIPLEEGRNGLATEPLGAIRQKQRTGSLVRLRQTACVCQFAKDTRRSRLCRQLCQSCRRNKHHTSIRRKSCAACWMRPQS